MDKAIKEMAEEAYKPRGVFRLKHHRLMIRGERIDGKIRLVKSSEIQLQESLRFKELQPSDQNGFINTRNMAIAGISTGGILYFLPGQSVFFWETDEGNLPDGSFRDDVLMSPLIGGILNGVLTSMQREIKNNNYEVMGSQKMGRIMMVVLNPANTMVEFANRSFHNKVFTSGITEIATRSPLTPYYPAGYFDRPPNYIGIQFQLRF